MFEMSGLENYQVAIVRAKGRGSGGQRGDRKGPVQTEFQRLIRAEPSACPVQPGYRPQEQHANLLAGPVHTHITDKQVGDTAQIRCLSANAH